jgi:hypothetical protein
MYVFMYISDSCFYLPRKDDWNEIELATNCCLVGSRRPSSFRFQVSRVMALNQGDQMSLWKSCPKCSPTHFLWNLIQNVFFVKTSIPNIWAFSLVKKTAQRKQSPSGRKFAQSGHPALHLLPATSGSSNKSEGTSSVHLGRHYQSNNGTGTMCIILNSFSSRIIICKILESV